MMGAMVKSYFAEKEGIDPKDVFVVSIMPCTAKKFEATRPELSRGGVPDVDLVLTTREFSRLINLFGIDFAELPEEDFDPALGLTTGSGDIFAASGGVMESTLRTAYHLVTGRHLESLEFKEVRGFEGVKEATVSMDGLEIRVAVVNTLANARQLAEKVRRGEGRYHFIEVMACPGGCVGGGGQIYGFETERIRKRIQAIYKVEKSRRVRRSYQSEPIQELYRGYLKNPGSHAAHELLHTHYSPRARRT
jgi:iron only hydrogenase large subunit-like protein